MQAVRDGALYRAGQEAAAGATAALQAARHLERLLPGSGWEHSQGQLQQALLTRLQPFTALLAALPELERLAAALGRVEGATRGKRPLKGGGEEVVGVRLGGRISEVLPSELALLADPATEDLFYLRWIERRLVSLELTGGGQGGAGEPEKRGPILAVVDTSGSMRGAPEIAAKALILALARRVVPAGRVLHLILFGGPYEVQELRIARGPGALDALLAFLGHGFYGGTELHGPLTRALQLLEERALRRADLLLITDGLVDVSPALEAAIRDQHDRTQLTVWGLVLRGGRADSIRALCDELWALDPRDASLSAGLIDRFGVPRRS